MKKKYFLISFFAIASFMVNFSKAQLISPTGDGGFETGATFPANNWTVVNNTTNKWFVGNATAPSAGGRCAYISNNGGTNNNYTTNTSQVSHFYRDVTIPAGTASLTFKYKGRGESFFIFDFDYINVYLVDVTVTPVAGTALPGANVIGGPYNLSPGGGANWKAITINFPCNPSTVTKRLVFSWINNNSGGNNPAGAIDEVNLTSNPSSAPANDLPCNAVNLPVGLIVSGNNQCTGNTGEPAPPACFTNGANQVHTVWYKFTAPSSCVKIKTTTGSLSDTQIGVYSGACGSLIAVAGGCSNDYQPCGSGGYTYNYSQVQLNVTAGTVYYIMVDGVNAQQGSFSIQVIDGGAGCVNNFPPVPVQDCALPFLVCNRTISVPNPGYQAVGNNCDFPSPSTCTGGTAGCGPCATTCLCTGERGSSWYKITINAPGFLEFWIVPNDNTGTPGAETDYDFAIYGPNPTCSNLTSPIRCDFDPTGVTGCYGASANTAPPGYAAFAAAFRNQIAVNTGETYLLNVSNYENSNSGFTLNIANTSPIATSVPPGGTVIWTGSVNTDWFNANNWGGCQIPDCDVNVSIPSFPVNQPVITGQNASCRSIDINPSAKLSINTGWQLMVCNNFTNNGTFTAQSNSTVLFQDTAVTAPLTNLHNQTISGSVTGANKFWNVTVNKIATFGVTTTQDIDMAGNFLVSGAAGFGGYFTATNKYHKVAGNFTIETTPLLATYNPAATLEFNGTAQTYLNRGSLINATMNQSGAGTLTLQDPGSTVAWMQISNAGTLNLTYGKIIADIVGNNRVDVFNRASTSVTTGNVNSYIEGALRRSMPNTGGLGSYDFPVGTSARGYERINFNLTTALPNTIDYWNVYFDNTSPSTNLGLGTECSVTYHTAGLLALNHGYWNVETSPASMNAGKMNVTNYNRSYTNPTGSGWTVMYDNATINTPPNWKLNPFPPLPCLGSPITAVQRSSVNIPALFTGNPVWFGTAQSQTPLPVELLNFEAINQQSAILLKWITASEKNNKGFELQRTISPPDYFEKIAWMEGHGTTSLINNYEFEDKNIKGGITYYYRLKQMDNNGNYSYSKIVAGKIAESDFLFNVIPNPYSGNTHIIYTLQQNSKVKIDIFNTLGQKIATIADSDQDAGNYQVAFSAKALGFSAGVYSIHILINDKVYTKRILETE